MDPYSSDETQVIGCVTQNRSYLGRHERLQGQYRGLEAAVIDIETNTTERVGEALLNRSIRGSQFCDEGRDRSPVSIEGR